MNMKDLLKDAYREGMTLEEVEAALEGIEMPDNESLVEENNRLKTALSKSNTENAAWKKKLREKETDEERKARETQEKWDQLEGAYNELLKSKTISDNKSQLLALGYADDLAQETAQAMFDNDNAKVFANQKKFMESKLQSYKEELMKSTPKPGAGGKQDGMDYQKEADLAIQSGDFVKSAYYTRLAGQSNDKNGQ